MTTFTLRNPSHQTITDQHVLACMCTHPATVFVVNLIFNGFIEVSIYLTEEDYVIGETRFLSLNQSIYIHFSSDESFYTDFFTGVPTAEDVLSAIHAESLRQNEC